MGKEEPVLYFLILGTIVFFAIVLVQEIIPYVMKRFFPGLSGISGVIQGFSECFLTAGVRGNTDPSETPYVYKPYSPSFVITIDKEDLDRCRHFHNRFGDLLRQQRHYYWKPLRHHYGQPDMFLELCLRRNQNEQITEVDFELWWSRPTKTGNIVIGKGCFGCCFDLSDENHQKKLAEILAFEVCNLIPKEKPEWETLELAPY